MHYFSYKENGKHNVCIHKFIAAESEDLTPLVNIISVGHYLSRFSILVKVYSEVRFPFERYPINVFQKVSLPKVYMSLQPWRHYSTVVETNSQGLNNTIRTV